MTNDTPTNEFRVGNEGAAAAAMLREASTLEGRAKALKRQAADILDAKVKVPRAYGLNAMFRGVRVAHVARGTNKSTNYDRLAELYPEAAADPEIVVMKPYTYWKA
jgi:hypothetical protein